MCYINDRHACYSPPKQELLLDKTYNAYFLGSRMGLNSTFNHLFIDKIKPSIPRHTMHYPNIWNSPSFRRFSRRIIYKSFVRHNAMIHQLLCKYRRQPRGSFPNICGKWLNYGLHPTMCTRNGLENGTPLKSSYDGRTSNND